jgi:integrase
VADFLAKIAEESRQTATLYASPIKYLNSFIQREYNNNCNIQTILPELKSGKIDIYKMLTAFIDYLRKHTTNGADLSRGSIRTYMSAVRSYFVYSDIDVSAEKVRYKVAIPKMYREKQKAINASDIKNILQHCDNRRLKTYLLVLASSGLRATEALSIRECDIDFSGIDFADPNDTANPATIDIRARHTKTKQDRTVFISNEAARYLHDWIEWIYRDKTSERGPNTHQPLRNRQRTQDDLIFASHAQHEGRSPEKHPRGLYGRLSWDFQRVLKLVHLDSRKEDVVYKRHKVTLHSFRRFVKTIAANQKNSDFSEYLLGHAGSPYYRNTAEELKQIYKDCCMKYLTFLSYPTVEAVGKSYEAKLEEKDKEIELLRRRDTDNADRITTLEDKLGKLSEQYHLTDVPSNADRRHLDDLQAQIDNLCRKLGMQQQQD